MIRSNVGLGRQPDPSRLAVLRLAVLQLAVLWVAVLWVAVLRVAVLWVAVLWVAVLQLADQHWCFWNRSCSAQLDSGLRSPYRKFGKLASWWLSHVLFSKGVRVTVGDSATGPINTFNILHPAS